MRHEMPSIVELAPWRRRSRDRRGVETARDPHGEATVPADRSFDGGREPLGELLDAFFPARRIDP
jgi:hypothetical protein